MFPHARGVPPLQLAYRLPARVLGWPSCRFAVTTSLQYRHILPTKENLERPLVHVAPLAEGINFASVARTGKLLVGLYSGGRAWDEFARRARLQAKLNMKLCAIVSARRVLLSQEICRPRIESVCVVPPHYSRMLNFISRLETDMRAAEEEILIPTSTG